MVGIGGGVCSRRLRDMAGLSAAMGFGGEWRLLAKGLQSKTNGQAKQ